MADESAREIDFLPPGMAVDTLGKGPYLQNLERRGDAWHVRPGFGQVMQFDTTLAFDTITVERHLGSAYMKTDFGHEQVISAFRVSTFTGSLFAGTDARDTGQYLAAYLVTIHDLTTAETWEELLYPKTAAQIADVERRHGLYETSRDESFEDYLSGDDSPFFFEELADTLYFGNRRAGLWGYFPATFRGTKVQQVNGHDRRDWLFRGPSESSLLVQAVPANGIFADGFAYLGTATFPKASAVVPFLNRLVFLDGRTVWFSDAGRPTSIIGGNFLQIPSENDLTGGQEIGGNLLLFTANETFFYQPTTGVLLSGGRLTKVADHIGCANPNAVTRANGAVVWMDARSAYATNNGLNIEDIGQGKDEVGMREFWRSAISNPLTAHYQQAGHTTLALDQPRLQHVYAPEGAHVAYDHVRDALIFGFPDIAFALVLSRGRWNVWNFESVAAAANTVRALRNVRSPWFLMGEKELFLVGSSEDVTISDQATRGGTPGGSASGENFAVGSWYLLRYGRGGGLDRSISYDVEDVRRISGKVYSFDATMLAAGAQSAYYVGEWVKVPTNWVFPNASVATSRTYLLPVEVVPGQTLLLLPDRLTLIIRFDNLQWAPILKGATTELDFLLPSERLRSVAGYSPGAPVAGSSEVQVYNSGTGLVSATGNEVRIRWNGSVAGYAAAPYSPNINISLRQRNRMIYLPFRYSGLTTVDVMNMGLVGITATIERIAGGGAYSANAEVLAWQQPQFNSRHSTDSVAQPVDWIVKSAQLGLRGRLQLLLRTIYLKLRSHGSATTVVPTGGSVFGLLNVLIGSDWKGWTSQVVDYEGNLDDVPNVQTIRSRLRNTAAAMVRRVFEGGSTGALWGDPTDSTRGNFLVDDEQVDTVAVSDSVKGEHVEVMLFGHVRNTAEGVAFDDAKATVRPRSARRRWGR